MKDIIKRLLVRNGLAVGAAVVFLVLIQYAPSSFYGPARIIVTLGGLVSLIAAANCVLWRHARHWLAVPLIVLLTVTLGFVAILVSVMIGKSIKEHRYRASGMAMTNGCNAAKAMRAEIELYEISDRIEQVKRTPGSSASELEKLEYEYETAKVRLRFWELDLRTRGHSGTVPVNDDVIHVPEDTSRKVAGP